VQTEAQVVTTSSRPSTVPVPGVEPGAEVRIDPTVKAALQIKFDVSPTSGAIIVTPTNGWTGRAVVPVITIKDGREVEVFVDVVVNPDVPEAPKFAPKSIKESVIAWQAPPSQVVRYEVELNGEIVCVVSTTSCKVKTIIGPSSKINVVAIGNDATQSEVAVSAYNLKKPIPALSVNFTENSAVLTSAEKRKMRAIAAVIKREGFPRLYLQGHTDAQGGNRNATALSTARAKVSAAYFQKLLPKVKFVALKAFGLSKPVANNATKAGQAKNRRAELLIR
jgi:outer membrane protein OmpA-like peptidoglycan-associated protein